MEYYKSAYRQYDGHVIDSLKFPTNTNLVGSVQNPGILSFSKTRTKPDIDISQLDYRD